MRASLYSRTALSAVLLAMISLAAAAPADPAPTAPATPPPAATTPATPAPTPPPPANAVQTQQINFNNSIKDVYSQYDWMVVQIDFVVRNNLNPDGNSRWAENVEVTMTMGWGTKSPTAPQVEMAVGSTVRLAGAEVGRVCTTFFFVPPEVLQRGIRKTQINARSLPSFYVVQYKINGQTVKITKADTSSSLPDANWWDGFLEVAGGKLSPGWLMNDSDVPPYVLTAVLARVSPGNMVPTPIRTRP